MVTKSFKNISLLLSILLTFSLLSPINTNASFQPDLIVNPIEEKQQIEGSPIGNELIGGEDNDLVQPQALQFLIPVLTPVITRIGTQIFVRQYLSNTTKNIIVRNHALAGSYHSSGVLFNRNGFPMFTSKYTTTQLPMSKIKDSDYLQFKWANADLKNAIEKNSYLKGTFNQLELNEIYNNKTPSGYTWHHHENTGYFQLVKTSQHKATGHTGGRAIWGTK